jgi:hypothetical protein
LRKSPYAGDSCSLTSIARQTAGYGWVLRPTVDVLALCQVAVVDAGEQRIAVAAHDALDVAAGPC